MNKESKERIQLVISKIISIIFHPLLMPSYALLIVFNSGTHYSFIPVEAKKLIYVLVILTTIVVPVSIIPFLIHLKRVSDFSMQKGKERFIPLLVTTISYFFSFQLLHKISLSTLGFIEMMVLGSAILVLLCMLISLKWKISAHLIGMGGLLGAMFLYALFFIADFTYTLILISLVTGLVAYARLNLQAHKPSQIYAGFLTGFSGMLIVLALGM
jgi:hypothetical protein